MKIMQTVASSTGFRDNNHNPTRLQVLAELLTVATRESVELVILPGGYLTANREADLNPAIDEVARLANCHRLAVVGGLDVMSRPSGKQMSSPGKGGLTQDQQVAQGCLPYFGFALYRDQRSVWRQTSSSAANAETLEDRQFPSRNRLVDLGGRKVAVLICGELFNWRARQAMLELYPDIVVDLGHVSMGQGLIPAMRNLASMAGCPIAHSQHLASWYGRSIHWVDGQGVQDSVSTESSPFLGDDEFWISWCLRSI
jgi:hypothetical protein